MPDDALNGPELKKFVKLARRGRLPFAFNPGKDPAEHYFAMHRKKPGNLLAKTAKKEGPGVKVAFGTCEVEQKVMKLTCERVIPALAKNLKRFLKANKVMLNVQVLDANGNVLEEDIEDMPDDPDLMDDGSDTAAAAEPGDKDLQAAEEPVSADQQSSAGLVARIKSAQQRAATLPDAAAKLNDALKSIVAQIKAQELDAADKAMTTVEGVIDKLSGPANDRAADPHLAKLTEAAAKLRVRAEGSVADVKAKLDAALDQADGLIQAADASGAAVLLKKVQAALTASQVAQEKEQTAAEKAAPDQAKWEAAFVKISPLAEKALSMGQVADVDAFRTAWNWATNCASDGDYSKALAALPKVVEMLKAGRDDGRSAFAADIPDDVKPFAESRLRWESARAKMQSEIRSLQSTIVAATADIEDLDVTSEIGGLMDYIKNLDARLEDKLDEIVNTPAGDAREKLKVEARSLIAEYERELENEFFEVVDNNSGFGNIAVASTARSALASISGVLS